MKRIILATAFLVGLCGLASAQAVSLGRPTTDNVFVWKDRDAAGNAVRFLRDNGVSETTWKIVETFMLACRVDKGTSAIVTGSGRGAIYDVQIISGPHTGCKGVIHEEDAGL